MIPAGRVVSVAFQGELGAFSEEAAYRLFGQGADPVPIKEFREVGRAVAQGRVEAGVLPIENTLAGTVVGSLDVLASEELRVVGEVILPVHHCVMAVPGTSLERITRVRSHPVALAQCTRFLERTAIEAVAAYDTAGAAREVANNGDPSVAAIASATAAERYGLDILAANVEDRPDNQTRFLAVVQRDGSPAWLPGDRTSGSVPMKTALLVDLPNEPGMLARLLVSFADRGINLSKLESRPGAEPWTYRFFIEMETDAGSSEGRQAVDAARECAAAVWVLGSFPRHGTPEKEFPDS